MAPLVLFGVFDAPARYLFGIETNFSNDPNLLGARMLFVVIVVTVVSVTVTLLTKPTEEERLKQFILRVRPFHFFWMPVIRRLDCHFEPPTEEASVTCGRDRGAFLRSSP
jgi:hypothetical protein